jgi:hypothetical protein
VSPSVAYARAWLVPFQNCRAAAWQLVHASIPTKPGWVGNPWRRHAIGERCSIVLVDTLVIRGHVAFDDRVFPERVADLLNEVAEEAARGRRRAAIQCVALGLEGREIAAPGVDVGGVHGLVARPRGDLLVQIVDATHQVLAPLGKLEARRVRELHQTPGLHRVAHVQVEYRDALQVIGGLHDQDVAHALRRWRRGVGIAVRFGRADDDGREVRHGVGDPLGFAPSHRG